MTFIRVTCTADLDFNTFIVDDDRYSAPTPLVPKLNVHGGSSGFICAVCCGTTRWLS